MRSGNDIKFSVIIEHVLYGLGIKRELGTKYGLRAKAIKPSNEWGPFQFAGFKENRSDIIEYHRDLESLYLLVSNGKEREFWGCHCLKFDSRNSYSISYSYSNLPHIYLRL